MVTRAYRCRGKRIREGEAPAEPKPDRKAWLGRSLAVPHCSGTPVSSGQPAFAAAPNPSPSEDNYYTIERIPIPSDIVLECGGMEFLPNGTLAVSTRRGDIYFLENPLSPDPKKIHFSRWATGMHEVMGLAYNKKDGFLYAIQRGEITRLKDTDGRGHANVYETFCDDWGISGDYHEYPWMSKFDKDGNLWVLPDSHRLLYQRSPLSRLVPACHARRQDHPNLQRSAISGRNCDERQGRSLLPGKPGPVGRRG